jgi:hypothetical protein
MIMSLRSKLDELQATVEQRVDKLRADLSDALNDLKGKLPSAVADFSSLEAKIDILITKVDQLLEHVGADETSGTAGK